MSTASEYVGLTRKMTWEEQKELLGRVFDAVEQGDDDAANSLVKQLPLLPGLAKVAYGYRGREYCEQRFNLSEANEEFGEGWMDD